MQYGYTDEDIAPTIYKLKGPEGKHLFECVDKLKTNYRTYTQNIQHLFRSNSIKRCIIYK